MTFYFIVPRTPFKYRTPERELLWHNTKLSLLAQKYKNWKVIIIGTKDEELIEDNRFVFLEFDLLPKGQKLIKAIEYLMSLDITPNYLIRLDDDDIVSSDKLFSISLEYKKWDCYTDEYHAFFEMSLGKVSLQKRPWFPNSTIHSYQHGVAKIEVEGNENYLIAHDHSKAWHLFYAKKNILFSKKHEPIYLRILSENSITSKLAKDYTKYLLLFGTWNFNIKKIHGFEYLMEYLIVNMIGQKRLQVDSFNRLLLYRKMIKERIFNIISFTKFKIVHRISNWFNLL